MDSERLHDRQALELVQSIERLISLSRLLITSSALLKESLPVSVITKRYELMEIIDKLQNRLPPRQTIWGLVERCHQLKSSIARGCTDTNNNNSSRFADSSKPATASVTATKMKVTERSIGRPCQGGLVNGICQLDSQELFQRRYSCDVSGSNSVSSDFSLKTTETSGSSGYGDQKLTTRRNSHQPSSGSSEYQPIKGLLTTYDANDNLQQRDAAALLSPVRYKRRVSRQASMQAAGCNICTTCLNRSKLCILAKSTISVNTRRKCLSRSLLTRMAATSSPINKFPVYMSDLLSKHMTGWLSVDESHRFYCIISDCLLTLFESSEAESSLMTLVLEQCTAEPVDMPADTPNAFTITIKRSDQESTTSQPSDKSTGGHEDDDDEIDEEMEQLYFYCDSRELRSEWLMWIRVGALLPLADLLAEPMSLDRDASTQTESEYKTVSTNTPPAELNLPSSSRAAAVEANRLPARPLSLVIQSMSQSSIEEEQETGEISPTEDVLDQTASPIADDVARVVMRQRKGALCRDVPYRSYHSIVSAMENACQLKELLFGEKNQNLDLVYFSCLKDSGVPFVANQHDGHQDQGMDRHYASNKQLGTLFRNRKCSSFVERSSVAVDAADLSSRDRSISFVKRLDISEEQKAARKISRKSYSLTGDATTSAKPSAGARFMKRATSLFTTKSEGLHISKKKSAEKSTSAVTRSADDLLFSTDEMASLYEMQGYLYIKRVLRWSQCYCTVNGGFFCCYKDVSSSVPSFQCHLTQCQVTPVDGKKARRPFVFRLDYADKSVHMSAVSDLELQAWYEVFNKYILSALEMGAYSHNSSTYYSVWDYNGEKILLSSDSVIVLNHRRCSHASTSSAPEDDEISDCDSMERQVRGRRSRQSIEFHCRATDSPTRSHSQIDSDTDEIGESSSDITLSPELDLLPARSEDSGVDIIDNCSERSHQTLEGDDSANHTPVQSPSTSSKESMRASYRKAMNKPLFRKTPAAALYSKSTDDLPSLALASSTSDESSSDESDAIKAKRHSDSSSCSSSGNQVKMSGEERRRRLLDKMIKEKERIERSLQQSNNSQEEDDTMPDELDAEMYKRMTMLKQRRVSTQLKYDFLEKQLNDKSSSADKQKTLKIKQKKTRVEKTSSSENAEANMKKQLEELRLKLDSLDKGLNETQSRHTETVNRVLHNRPASMSDPPPVSLQSPTNLHSSGSSTGSVDMLTKHKLKGLESIIEALDGPSSRGGSSMGTTLPRPHSIAACDTMSFANPITDTPKEISLETLAVISEFEAMTRELLKRRTSIKYDT